MTRTAHDSKGPRELPRGQTHATARALRRRDSRREFACSSVAVSLGAALTGAWLVACGNVDTGVAVGPAPTASASPSGAASACPPAPASDTRYLRQLSLDLRGRPPSAEELDDVAAGRKTPEALLDEMLASEEFVTRVGQWHRAQLWPTLDGFRVRAQPVIAVKVGARLENGSLYYSDRYGPDPTMRPSFVEANRSNMALRDMLDSVLSFEGGEGDRPLRGGRGTVGCDTTLRYPAADADEGYTTTAGTRRTYYDPRGVPLPYYDAAHCPNYCVARAAVDVPAEAVSIHGDELALRARRALASSDFSAMSTAGAPAGSHELDPRNCGSGSNQPCACPGTHLRVINPCDNAIYAGADQPFRLRREGYVMALHYWTEGREVRTCAYEAQSRATSVTTGQSCAGRALRDSSCGCGPEGTFCMPSIASYSDTPSLAEYRLRRALASEPLRIVMDVVRNDEPYYEVFRTRRGFVNGPLARFFRDQTPAATGLEFGPPAPRAQVPDVPYDPPPASMSAGPTRETFDTYDEGAWQVYVRGPEHAGVLTTAAYLGRFPTWRSRVAQFRSAFMCRPFTPGSNNFPPPTDACNREPNIARRCGCQNCHAALEPMGAYFGRWAERSTRYLAPTDFPEFDPNCQACATQGYWSCSVRCRNYYNVDSADADGARYFGTLRGYLYRTPDEVSRIDEGPAGLVRSAMASGELQSCTVKRAWANLLGRPMNERELREVLPELTERFDHEGQRYRALVRAIVTSPAYRRVD